MKIVDILGNTLDINTDGQMLICEKYLGVDILNPDINWDEYSLTSINSGYRPIFCEQMQTYVTHTFTRTTTTSSHQPLLNVCHAFIHEDRYTTINVKGSIFRPSEVQIKCEKKSKIPLMVETSSGKIETSQLTKILHNANGPALVEFNNQGPQHIEFYSMGSIHSDSNYAIISNGGMRKGFRLFGAYVDEADMETNYPGIKERSENQLCEYLGITREELEAKRKEYWKQPEKPKKWYNFFR